MLNPEFKEKWAAALESDQYQQTRAMLYDGKGYCCLGIACVVAGATFSNGDDPLDNYHAMRDGELLEANDCNSILSPAFAAEIGLTLEEQRKLYRMNDGYYDDDGLRHHEQSFKEIAVYIRTNL